MNAEDTKKAMKCCMKTFPLCHGCPLKGTCITEQRKPLKKALELIEHYEAEIERLMEKNDIKTATREESLELLVDNTSSTDLLTNNESVFDAYGNYSYPFDAKIKEPNIATGFCPKCETTNQELALDIQGEIGKAYGSLESHFTNLEITKCDKITLTLDSVDISVGLPIEHFDRIKKIIINGNEFVRKEQK